MPEAAEGTQAPEPTTTDPATEEKPDTGVDHAAELDKWKAQVRKHEERAKANAAAAKELEEFKRATMSDQEKAVSEAVTKATADAMVRVGSKLVDAEVKVALAGRSVDVEALLDGLDRSRFLSDDGEPKVDDIAAWADRIAPRPDPNAPPPTRQPVDMGQGARPQSAIGQLDRAALKFMTPQQIKEARKEGRLDDLFAGKKT